MSFTPDQWLILLLAFVLGLVLGMALLASPKWKARYREELAKRQELEAENERLRSEFDTERDRAATRHRIAGRLQCRPLPARSAELDRVQFAMACFRRTRATRATPTPIRSARCHRLTSHRFVLGVRGTRRSQGRTLIGMAARIAADPLVSRFRADHSCGKVSWVEPPIGGS